MSQGSEMTSRASGWLASSTNSACCRSSRCSRPPATSTGRRRWLPASAWCTTAAGDDDHPVAGQVGPPAQVDVVAQQRAAGGRGRRAASHTSRRTSIPAVPTASTARVPSCWPWSCSRRSSPVSRRPPRAIVTPTSSSSRRSPRPSTLGPATATCGSRVDLGEQLARGRPARARSRRAAPRPSRPRGARLEGGGDRGAEPGARGEVGDRVAAEPVPHRGQRPVAALGRRAAGVGRHDGVGRPGLAGQRGPQAGESTGRRGGRPPRRSR